MPRRFTISGDVVAPPLTFGDTARKYGVPKAEVELIRTFLRGDKGLFAYEVAVIHAALEQTDDAFERLLKAVQERSGWIAYLRRDPRLDALHGGVRFADLHRTAGSSS